MKMLFSKIFAIGLLLSCLTITSTAICENTTVYDDISKIYLEDGSYFIISIVEEADYARSSNTKSGQKKIIHYNTNDEILWSATLKATFTYTGSSATCTNTTISYSVNDSNWSIISATATKSANSATGNVVAKQYFVGIPIKTLEQSVTLTCSADGTLS